VTHVFDRNVEGNIITVLPYKDLKEIRYKIIIILTIDEYIVEVHFTDFIITDVLQTG
jgi:hypothetical protein